MKKSLWQSYLDGIFDREHGENYRTIIAYFLPEFVTALILYSIVGLLDARFIASLQSTSCYATLGVTNTLVHFVTKVAEGLSVGTVILCGQYNGAQRYKEVGISAISAVWVTFFSGFCLSLFLYIAAPALYSWYGVPERMALLGVPFLRIRSISIFFMFLFFAVIGFLRGIKNTRVPMFLFLLGAVVFLFFDYGLIFGVFGLPHLGLYGSAVACIIQYVVMLIGALLYLFFDEHNRRYSLTFFSSFDRTIALQVIRLSWPVMIDKATLALAKIWLVKMINPMGKVAIASFTVIKDMEQLAFIPAIALGQVVTFLVSNDYALRRWQSIKSNIKKILLLSSTLVFAILLTFSYWPASIICYFDSKNVFTLFASKAFPIISVLVFLDLLQLILAGALRGAADVKVVMATRLVVLFLFVMPLSYVVSTVTFSSDVTKFIAIYASFYIGNGLMSLVYLYRLRGERWKEQMQVTAHKD